MSNQELYDNVAKLVDESSVQHVLVSLATLMYARGQMNAAQLIAQTANRPSIINLPKFVSPK